MQCAVVERWSAVINGYGLHAAVDVMRYRCLSNGTRPWHCTTLHYLLHCTTLHCTTLLTALHYTALHRALYNTALQCEQWQCFIQQCTTLNRSTVGSTAVLYSRPRGHYTHTRPNIGWWGNWGLSGNTGMYYCTAG